MCERGGSGARGVECGGLQRFQGCLADAHLCLRVGSFELPKKDIESGRYGANPWQSSQMHNLECHSHHNVQPFIYVQRCISRLTHAKPHRATLCAALRLLRAVFERQSGRIRISSKHG